MNTGFRIALYAAGGSMACGILAVLETMTGIVSWLAPSEVWLFVWLAIGVVCATIARSYLRGAIAMPSVRRLVMPQPKHRYGQRTRRVI